MFQYRANISCGNVLVRRGAAPALQRIRGQEIHVRANAGGANGRRHEGRSRGDISSRFRFGLRRSRRREGLGLRKRNANANHHGQENL